MTFSDAFAAVQAVCPVTSLGLNQDGSFRIDFDPSATAQQQQAAQSYLATARINGQPARQANDILNIFNYIKPAAGNLNATQLQNLQLLCCAVVLNQFPQLAQRINQNMGVSIPYDQANPNG